jgi:hypothetical protein
MSADDPHYTYPPSDPYAERPTEVYQGIYRSGDSLAQPLAEEPVGMGADDTAESTELSHQALQRLRARLVRKYH